MNNQEIIKCLKANKEIAEYELNITHKKSKELFYVLKNLEMNRSVDATSKVLTIYVKDKDKLGSSSLVVLSCDDLSSLKKKINLAINNAKTAMNNYYELPSNIKNIDEKEIKVNLGEVAKKIADIVYKIDGGKDSWINSTEIFVSKINKEFISSKGIHHKTSGIHVAIEVVPTCSNNGEEFEQYRFYESNEINYSEIKRKIEGILKKAKSRAYALNIKDVKLPKDLKVLVKGEMVSTIVDNIKENLSYYDVYTKTSHYKLGDSLFNKDVNVKLKGYGKGCSSSLSYDGHGVNLKDKEIISNGKVIGFAGDAKYGYYLKEKKIAGDLPIVEVKAIGSGYEKDKHLIIESFSSPQLDESTGYFGGEVRLARYFNGKEYIPLTGFTLSGNIYKDLKNVGFSKRETTLKNYIGPKYFIFKGLDIH